VRRVQKRETGEAADAAIELQFDTFSHLVTRHHGKRNLSRLEDFGNAPDFETKAAASSKPAAIGFPRTQTLPANTQTTHSPTPEMHGTSRPVLSQVAKDVGSCSDRRNSLESSSAAVLVFQPSHSRFSANDPSSLELGFRPAITGGGEGNRRKPMKAKLLAATVVVAAFTTPALADFWIVQDSSTKRCNIVEQRPTTTATTIVGNREYKTRVEAENQMKTVEVCRETTTGGPARVPAR